MPYKLDEFMWDRKGAFFLWSKVLIIMRLEGEEDIILGLAALM